MKIEFKKRRRDVLEKIFVYPSFSLRFWFYTVGLLILVGIPTLFIISQISTWSNRLSGMNIALQGITLIFGVIATFFALRQLTESRFSKLDESAMESLKNKQYFRAINIWREALYIKADSGIFFNLMETLLAAGQEDEFDIFLGHIEKSKSFQQSIITEPEDYIIFCYLQIFRNLFVENMGAAKCNLKILIEFIKENKSQPSIGWNFDDIRDSTPYNKLIGDHKTVADNLVKYLEKQLSPAEKIKFENENYVLSL